MAIQWSDLKYPKVMSYKDVNGLTYYGGLRYVSSEPRVIYYDFSTDIEFVCDYNASSDADAYSEYETLFEFSNGITYKFRYKKWLTTDSMTQETTHLKLDIHTFDYTGTIMGAYSNTTSMTRAVINGVAHREPLRYFHFVPCGYVDYVQSATRTSQAGDPPTGGGGLAWACWVEEHTPMNMPTFTTNNAQNTFNNCFGIVNSIGGYNEQTLNQFYSNFITYGDGTDPFGIKEPDKPYDPSDPGGGDSPQYDPSISDPIDFPSLPTGSAFTTGLITAYNPTAAELSALANELWSSSFVNTIEKVLNDPFDGIIGLMMYPFAITQSTSLPIKIGNYTAQNASAHKVLVQYVSIEGGSFQVPLAWYNFLDFTQTKLSLYVPFVGMVPINPDDAMGKTLSIKYNVDLLSGSGTAFVKSNNSVLYNFPVNVGSQIPLTGSSKGALYTGLVNIATSTVTGAMAGGGAGAIIGGAAGAIGTASTKGSDVSRSGSISGNSGILSDFTAYIIIHRPVQSLPAQFKNNKGYMSNMFSQLSALTGYTEVEYVHLEGISGATDTELQEIENLLKSGVII